MPTRTGLTEAQVRAIIDEVVTPQIQALGSQITALNSRVDKLALRVTNLETAGPAGQALYNG